MKWSQERVDLAKKLFAENFGTDAEIGREIERRFNLRGVTQCAVHNVLWRRVPEAREARRQERQTAIDDNAEKMRQLASEGYTLREIAHKFGVSVRTVRRAVPVNIRPDEQAAAALVGKIIAARAFAVYLGSFPPSPVMPDPILPAGKTLLECTGCQWTIGQSESGTLFFCDEPKSGRSSYCEKHRAQSVKVMFNEPFNPVPKAVPLLDLDFDQ